MRGALVAHANELVPSHADMRCLGASEKSQPVGESKTKSRPIARKHVARRRPRPRPRPSGRPLQPHALTPTPLAQQPHTNGVAAAVVEVSVSMLPWPSRTRCLRGGVDVEAG